VKFSWDHHLTIISVYEKAAPVFIHFVSWNHQFGYAQLQEPYHWLYHRTFLTLQKAIVFFASGWTSGNVYFRSKNRNLYFRFHLGFPANSFDRYCILSSQSIGCKWIHHPRGDTVIKPSSIRFRYLRFEPLVAAIFMCRGFLVREPFISTLQAHQSIL